MLRVRDIAVKENQVYDGSKTTALASRLAVSIPNQKLLWIDSSMKFPNVACENGPPEPRAISGDLIKQLTTRQCDFSSMSPSLPNYRSLTDPRWAMSATLMQRSTMKRKPSIKRSKPSTPTVVSARPLYCALARRRKVTSSSVWYILRTPDFAV